MSRWKPINELPDRTKRLIFGTTKPTKAQVALYNLTQYYLPVIQKVEGENEKNHLGGHGVCIPVRVRHREESR